VGQTHIETRKGATKVSSTPDENLRGGDGKRAPSDDAEDTDPPAPAEVANFYGAATVDGLWSFDISGRLIGFLNLGSFVITSTSTNATTNSFSFRGRARGGSRPRLTMMVEGVLGRSTYRGVPLTTLTDISGDYRVTGRRGNNSVVELFTLTAAGMNNYLVSGSGLGFGPLQHEQIARKSQR
jgi:hypothetical protein